MARRAIIVVVGEVEVGGDGGSSLSTGWTRLFRVAVSPAEEGLNGRRCRERAQTLRSIYSRSKSVLVVTHVAQQTLHVCTTGEAAACFVLERDPGFCFSSPSCPRLP